MPRPNILFLLSDEHSFRFMGHVPESEGGEPIETPAWDRLAAQGTVFTDAYCPMPLCTPSRICLLTGLEVRGCGAWTNNSILRPELATLPGTLAEAGYETCLVGKMHLGGNQQFVGFQHRPYGDLTGRCGHQADPTKRALGKDVPGMRQRTTTDVGIGEIPESLLQENIVCQEALAWLRDHTDAHPDVPWFLCASYSRPHFPLTAPRRHFEKYLPGDITEPKVGATGDAYEHAMSSGMRRGFMADDIDHDEMMRARGAYFACVSYLDEIVGDLLARLEAAGLLENTIVIYTTDHGEMAGEHGVWWKNGWYEACTRVPLIFSTPEQRRGEASARKVQTPVSLVDLFPTLSAMAGAECPGHLEGVDLSAAVREGAEPADRPVFCDALTPRWGEGTEFRSIRWKRWKYVTFRAFEPLMFDLIDDPAEQENLLARGVSGEAAEAKEYLEKLAADSIDFDEAERERVERDGPLYEEYPQDLPPSTSNLYLMPSGKLVSGGDVIYGPTVIAEKPEDAFGDLPQ